jgi:hypothetical protein
MAGARTSTARAVSSGVTSTRKDEKMKVIDGMNEWSDCATDSYRDDPRSELWGICLTLEAQDGPRDYSVAYRRGHKDRIIVDMSSMYDHTDNREISFDELLDATEWRYSVVDLEGLIRSKERVLC